MIRQAVAPTAWSTPGRIAVDVMIGSPSAVNFDGPHPTSREIWRLEEALALIETEYDLVLIDCAPNLNALTRMAWAASDRVGVVSEPGLFSVAAADRALRAIEDVRRGLSPRLQPLGLIVNRVRNASVEHQFRVQELREMFGPLVLSPLLPERTSLQQAQGAAQPVHAWPGEAAAEMAQNFDLLLERVMRNVREHPRNRWALVRLSDFADAAQGHLVVGVNLLGAHLDEARLDLANNLANRDTEHALTPREQVNDFVV